MNVGLIHVDGKYPNLALMKLSAWHKAQGDEVEFYYPMKEYDHVYASKVFSDSPVYDYIPENCEVGGWGYNTVVLPDEVEHTYPDYSLYNCDYALGFTSRGCIRNCPFCIVPEKEGHIRATADIYDFWRGQNEVMLMDNNLMALPDHFKTIMKQTHNEGLVVIEHGMDLRLIDKEKARLLWMNKPKSQWHFAWDNLKDEAAVRRGLKILKDNGVAPYKCMVYVLIGFDTTEDEDLYRVMELRALGVDPFVMPYDKTDPYQRRFARWVNHKAIFKSVEWKDYGLVRGKV